MPSNTIDPDRPREKTEPPRTHHVCPWWIGYLLASPLRKLGENPKTILAGLVEPGMTVVDIGCAMGFFSLPLARMVEDEGRVVCVDVQPRMLSTLTKRARRKRLDHIIETRACTQESLGLEDLEGCAGLALAVHVVHETTYPRRFLSQCLEALAPGGTLLILEPTGHVSAEDFETTRQLAVEVGFVERGLARRKRSWSIVLDKPPA